MAMAWMAWLVLFVTGVEGGAVHALLLMRGADSGDSEDPSRDIDSLRMRLGD